MKYGKTITTQSFFDGECTKTTVQREESIMASDKAELMRAILDGLSLVDNNITDHLTLDVYRTKDGFRIVRTSVD